MELKKITTMADREMNSDRSWEMYLMSISTAHPWVLEYTGQDPIGYMAAMLYTELVIATYGSDSAGYTNADGVDYYELTHNAIPYGDKDQPHKITAQEVEQRLIDSKLVKVCRSANSPNFFALNVITSDDYCTDELMEEE